MLFPIIVFLMVLSPLFIPVAVTVVHQFSNLRGRRLAIPGVRQVRSFRPMVTPVPAAA
jgi:hypothetical protein